MEDDLFTSESEYTALLKLGTHKTTEEFQSPVSPIENFEVIPDDYEKTRPRIVVLGNAAIEPD